MTRMRGDTKFQADEGRDPAAGPEVPAEAVGGGASMHQCGQAGQWLGRQPPRGPGGRPTPEGLGTAIAGPRQPLTDRALADTQGCGKLALGPAPLLELSGLESSGFFPGGWCGVHAWQFTTGSSALELSMSGSVTLTVPANRVTA
jgi:hypothetical protein